MKLYFRFLYSITFTALLLFVYFKFYKYTENNYLTVKSTKRSTTKHSTNFTLNEKGCVKNIHKINSEYTFQEVDEGILHHLSHVYVYSAFYDSRSSGKVVIMSVSDGALSNLQCIVWFSGNDYKIIQATMTMIPEGSSRLFTAAMIECPLEMEKTPLYVSILPNGCFPILNLIPIVIVPKVNISSDIAVCVTPFNLAYNKIDQFIETMSINRMFGASHTFFYNYSTGRNIDQIIDIYKQAGVVTVLPFHLPMKVHIWPLPEGYTEEIKYFGQMAALNDCLYRTMGHYQFVAFSDLDEYLVPRKLSNWRQLLGTTSKSTTAWLFRNTFFKIEWASDEEMMKNETIKQLKAMSLVKLLRTHTIEPAFQRSKLIVNPLFVVVMGVHNIWTTTKHSSLHIFPIEDGLCHHYRFWDGLGEKESVRDDNILRLREDIVAAVQKDREMLSHVL